MSFVNKTKDKASDNSLAVSLQELTGGFLFLVNQAPIVVTIINKKGIILYQSPSVKNLLGYEAHERVGKNFIRSKLMHPAETTVKLKLMDKAIKNPNTNIMGELRLKHKNGSWRWIESIYNNQLNNPAVNGIVVISQDIHERKLLELQQKEFISIASHELKTPLTTIRAYGQLLIKKNKKDPKNVQDLTFLENIVSQTDKLTGLINDLLDVSKLQEGQFPVERKPFQMEKLLKKMIEDFCHISELYTIELVRSTKAYVIGDENRVAQVVMNLLTNAIKYSPNATTIELTCSRKGNYIVTSVKDFGEGIPTSKQKFVFDRFFRIESKKSDTTSTGLGLYIAAEIIKLHNGNIWLESKKGKGSTFFFSLPIAKTN